MNTAGVLNEKSVTDNIKYEPVKMRKDQKKVHIFFLLH